MCDMMDRKRDRLIHRKRDRKMDRLIHRLMDRLLDRLKPSEPRRATESHGEPFCDQVRLMVCLYSVDPAPLIL